MKSVTDFLPHHKSSDEVIILGQCPSSKTTPFKNGTFARLQNWMDIVGLYQWSFHNVIPNKINSYKMSDVDVDALLTKTNGKVVIALGGFVSKVCNKYDIPHYKIDHPSPRNRNLNSKQYEIGMLFGLQRFLTEVGLY
jgi:hypothetical protein